MRRRCAPRRSLPALWLRPVLGAMLPIVLGTLACCGPATNLPLGDACDGDDVCASGFCSDARWSKTGARCADPSADLDGDGLNARLERIAGTNPGRSDTDSDGLADKVEVGPNPSTPLDRDGDGDSDAVESNVADSDSDCLRDVDDPDDDAVAESAALAAAACKAGVCEGQTSGAECDKASKKVRCLVAAGVGYEFGDEASCDAADNDCDGEVDEALDGLAGAACGVWGVCSAAKTSRCVGAKWICNLGHVADYEPIEKSCDGLDNDCDGQVDETTCDDGIACTKDTCAGLPSGCLNTPVHDLCNDGNPCTTDVCETVSDCRYLPRIGQCDDGLPCTTGESCNKSKCTGGTATICDDGNNCTLNPCNPEKGCVVLEQAFGSPCKPTDTCFQVGVCESGVCKGNVPVDCDDGSPCTLDSCASEQGCKHATEPGPCNDGNPCTKADTCVGEQCVGKPLATCCDKNHDCKDNSSCTQDVCVGGACINDSTPLEGKPCDDNNPCTLEEVCSKSVCAAKLLNMCSDGNICTLDFCEPATGCLHKSLSNGTGCDDGDVCNGNAFCTKASCIVGQPPDCDDGNPCTIDKCDPITGCSHAAHTGECTDGNACTIQDGCASGSCVGKALNCDDDNPCTFDGCSIDTGCVSQPTPGFCSDGDLCTVDDTCSVGVCIGQKKDCDDGKPCSVDACDAGACTHHDSASEDTACEDGNACTLGDICQGGVCKSGVTIDCSDGNDCTDDTCDTTSGFCKSVDNAKPCDTGTGCMVNGACSNGVCSGASKTDCCSLNVDCIDGNPCTLDSCKKDGDKSCDHTKLEGLACNDGSQCTVGGKCKIGKCVSATVLGCNDNQPCTIDYCLPDSGCNHLLTVSGDCSDGDLCNGLETCSPGGCTKGSPLVCSDGKACTFDSCKKALGCAYPFAPKATVCDDDSPCTTGDHCDGTGKCEGTPQAGPGCCTKDADCDDGYGCTTDKCDLTTALCGHKALSCPIAQGCVIGWCSQGACTSAQTCAEPGVYDEGFEAKVGGWSYSAKQGSDAGLGWQAEGDAKAQEGAQSLHCGWGNGTWQASLPPMALTAGPYRLKLAARLDIDGSDCSGGALAARLDGQPLGSPLCAPSAQMGAVELPFEVTAAGDVALSLTFTGAPKVADTKRGAWIDAVSVVAAKDSNCACGAAP